MSSNELETLLLKTNQEIRHVGCAIERLCEILTQPPSRFEKACRWFKNKTQSKRRKPL